MRGLAIGGFDGNGVVLQTGGGNRISGNYIGTNLAGTTPYDPLPTSTQGGHAILIQDSATNILSVAMSEPLLVGLAPVTAIFSMREEVLAMVVKPRLRL